MVLVAALVTLAAAASAAAGADAVAATATINADRSPETLLGDDAPFFGSTPELGDRRTLAKCNPEKNTSCCRDRKSKCAKQVFGDPLTPWKSGKPTKCAKRGFQGKCRASCDAYWSDIEFCYGPAYVGSKEELLAKMGDHGRQHEKIFCTEKAAIRQLVADYTQLKSDNELVVAENTKLKSDNELVVAENEKLKSAGSYSGGFDAGFGEAKNDYYDGKGSYAGGFQGGYEVGKATATSNDDGSYAGGYKYGFEYGLIEGRDRYYEEGSYSGGWDTGYYYAKTIFAR